VIARWSSELNWDTRIVYIERHQRWWWNAWLAATETELYGFADSQETAYRTMQQAIRAAATAPQLTTAAPDQPRDRQ
jgi:hypothetical protein